MIFTSLPFVVFFTLIYGLLAAVRNDVARRWILLSGSFFFYGYWNAWYLILMAAIILWSWGAGLFIASARSIRARQFGVAAGVALSLFALAVFKYAGFAAQNVAWITGGQVPAVIRDIVLPVGISFYTFHSISYYVDVYRGQISVTRSLRDYALYIAFFPQLVAGPIVRASQFLPQLTQPITLTLENFSFGARLFLAGAVQKLLLADLVSPFVDDVFANSTLYSGVTEWLAVFAYALQIFGDFSGYTLMAIGVARVLGFKLPENFRMPYVSQSITEFWQRWHITLSFFLRDYLYISLGGNRYGFLRTQRNVMITMLLGGLWHGANWNFVLWGGLHGAAIVVHHAWERIPSGQNMLSTIWHLIRRPFGWFLTFFFIVMVWIPFRAVHFSDTAEIMYRIWTFEAGVQWYHTPTLVVMMAAAVWHIAHVVGLRARLASWMPGYWLYTLEVTVMITLLLLFAPTSTSPFIYFQF